MNFSVCLDAIYAGQDFDESMRAIHALGATAFEFWSWWDKDLDRIQKTKAELGLQVATFCTRFISLVDPAQRDAYLAGLAETLAVAQRLDCKTIITQVGADRGIDRALQHQSLVDGLKACAPLLEKAQVTLVIEPLNTTIDHAGYYLYRSAEAFQIIDEAGSAQVKVLYDIYHQQIMEGNLINTIQPNIAKIGHFHAAGLPGRHELDLGEINYPQIFQAIDSVNYQGYVGLEYFPVREPASGLKSVIAGFPTPNVASAGYA